ncbi:hypothetical protein N9B45_01360, partial [bacterium]|nr:hypothetical protein [bacterium]
KRPISVPAEKLGRHPCKRALQADMRALTSLLAYRVETCFFLLLFCAVSSFFSAQNAYSFVYLTDSKFR